MARKDGDDAGELLLIDRLLHQRVQAFEPLGREADGLRLHHGQIKRIVRYRLRLCCAIDKHALNARAQTPLKRLELRIGTRRFS